MEAKKFYFNKNEFIALPDDLERIRLGDPLRRDLEPLTVFEPNPLMGIPMTSSDRSHPLSRIWALSAAAALAKTLIGDAASIAASLYNSYRDDSLGDGKISPYVAIKFRELLKAPIPCYSVHEQITDFEALRLAHRLSFSRRTSGLEEFVQSAIQQQCQYSLWRASFDFREVLKFAEHGELTSAALSAVLEGESPSRRVTFIGSQPAPGHTGLSNASNAVAVLRYYGPLLGLYPESLSHLDRWFSPMEPLLSSHFGDRERIHAGRKILRCICCLILF